VEEDGTIVKAREAQMSQSMMLVCTKEPSSALRMVDGRQEGWSVLFSGSGHANKWVMKRAAIRLMVSWPSKGSVVLEDCDDGLMIERVYHAENTYWRRESTARPSRVFRLYILARNRSHRTEIERVEGHDKKSEPAYVLI
jgi:hypothetical protein